jgi:hypothetical protein
MAKLPGFMFYPGDWQKDPCLRRATRNEKGLLMDLLCLMFESKERGVLADSSGPWTDVEIINAAGGDPESTSFELTELVRKGVLSRRTDGALFSRRLVREEHIRQVRSEAGSKGGNPRLLNQKSNQRVNHMVKQIPEYENENERVVSILKSKRKANYEEIKAFCSELNLPDCDSDYLFNHWEGNGWSNGGKPIKDWKRTIRAWKAAGHLPSQKNKLVSDQAPIGPTLEELKARIKK